MIGFGLMAIVPAAFAQTYNMDLTSAGNGTVADGVYVSPYVGTISGPGVNYSGYMICDDFNTESYLNSPWTATATDAGALNGTEKFGSSVLFDGVTYSAQQAYNAAGWLANGLLGNLSNSAVQTNYAFAIWDIFDGQNTDPSGGRGSLWKPRPSRPSPADTRRTMSACSHRTRSTRARNFWWCARLPKSTRLQP